MANVLPCIGKHVDITEKFYDISFNTHTVKNERKEMMNVISTLKTQHHT